MLKSNDFTFLTFCFISSPIYFWLDMDNLIPSRATCSISVLEKGNLCDFWFFIGAWTFLFSHDKKKV
jgi:hypothetical protein